jgi:hypothetical protein
MIGNKPGFALCHQGAERMRAHQRVHHLGAGFIELRGKVQNSSSTSTSPSLIVIQAQGERDRLLPKHTYIVAFY